MTRFAILFGLGLTLLVACSGGSLYNPHVAGNYNHMDLNADHGNKDMKLVVTGNPFLVGEDALFNAIASAMDGQNDGLPIHFTANPTLSPEAPGRIEVLFSPPADGLGRQLCAGTLTPSDAGDKSTAIMAYCTRDAEKTSIWIGLPQGSEPGDAAFQETFAQAILYMTPRHPLFDKPESCNPNC